MRLMRISGLLLSAVALLIQGVFLYLDRYAYLRGGMYKHLYFRRYNWEMDILSKSSMIWQIALILILIAACLYIIPRNCGHDKLVTITAAILLTICIGILLIGRNLLIYPYALAANLVLAIVLMISGFVLSHDK